MAFCHWHSICLMSGERTSTVERFKNNVSSGWLFSRQIWFMDNILKYWNDPIENECFFNTFEHVSNSTSAEAKAFLDHFIPESEDVQVDSRLRRVGRKYRTCSVYQNLAENLQRVWNEKAYRRECRDMLIDWSKKMVRRKCARRSHKDPYESRVDTVAEMLKLSPVERNILEYAIVRRYTSFDEFPVNNVKSENLRHLCIAMAVDAPTDRVMKSLRSDSALRKYEVLDEDGDLNCGNPFYDFIAGQNDNALEHEFYRLLDLKDALPGEYYGRQLQKHGEIIQRLIANSGARRGVNILFYGAPGTGKTSFAKTLAKAAGRSLVEIRQGGKDGDSDSSRNRMAGIRICNDREQPAQSIILVDEADELLRTSLDFGLFSRSVSKVGEKGSLNSLLDDISLPAIWISNASADSMDASVRRRFDYSVCFEELDYAQRLSIWRNNVRKLSLAKAIPDETLERFADRYPVSAGGITMVLENVKRLKTSKNDIPDMVDNLMRPHLELLGLKSLDADAMKPAKNYSLSGLNIKGGTKLEDIVSSVRRFRETRKSGQSEDRPRMNILLWGPPGTGKTEFVKYLAHTLKCGVLAKSGSDILDMYVGGTEKRIAGAFAEAESKNAILFLDEIDGLVQNRAKSSQSWEVSQVNELLQRMENFDGVMIAATNFKDNLDPAIMRRFTFKLEFGYLTDEGKAEFYERTFNQTLSVDDRRRLDAIGQLSPGDFRTVRQSLYYLGETVDSGRILDELAKESQLKTGVRRSRIGFGQ